MAEVPEKGIHDPGKDIHDVTIADIRRANTRFPGQSLLDRVVYIRDETGEAEELLQKIETETNRLLDEYCVDVDTTIDLDPAGDITERKFAFDPSTHQLAVGYDPISHQLGNLIPGREKEEYFAIPIIGHEFYHRHQLIARNMDAGEMGSPAVVEGFAYFVFQRLTEEIEHGRSQGEIESLIDAGEDTYEDPEEIKEEFRDANQLFRDLEGSRRDRITTVLGEYQAERYRENTDSGWRDPLTEDTGSTPVHIVDEDDVGAYLN